MESNTHPRLTTEEFWRYAESSNRKDIETVSFHSGLAVFIFKKIAVKQNAQKCQKVQKTKSSEEKQAKNLSTFLKGEKPKNQVMHEVIHIIHNKNRVFLTEKKGKNKQMFC